MAGWSLIGLHVLAMPVFLSKKSLNMSQSLDGLGISGTFIFLFFQLDSNLSPVLSKKIAKITCKTTKEMLKKLLKTFYKKMLIFFFLFYDYLKLCDLRKLDTVRAPL